MEGSRTALSAWGSEERALTKARILDFNREERRDGGVGKEDCCFTHRLARRTDFIRVER